jgi:beta-lactamase class D
MKKTIVFFTLLFSATTFADTKCFIAKENGKVIKSEGDCSTPYSPASTFKIALSLMGFDSGILKNKEEPSWSLPEGVDHFINVCKGDHNPRTWMRDSCLWYSRILTNKLGIKKFKEYISKFDYGNMDLSGDKGKNNDLTHSWVSSSLQISPDDQTNFLQKVVDEKLPISKESYSKTKEIIFITELAGGWKLYGKTGLALQLDQDGNKTDLQSGYFVGWIEKGMRKIVFANHIADDKEQDTFASFRARNEALIKLWHLIDDLHK